jgi:CubicO group peptidase (beta-lactamase class C family)
MLLSHQAGVCAFRDPAIVADFYDQPRAAARLAAQVPFWLPGQKFGYHARTIGILGNELFRRVEGRTLGAFVRDELAAPFALDLSIGLAPGNEARTAMLLAPPQMSTAGVGNAMTEARIATLTNPVLDPLEANTAAWRAAELPSANGFGNARSLARLYGALAHAPRSSVSLAPTK